MGVAVRITDARLRYGDEWIFKDIHLALEASHWTCLLGQSGVGKSSLLRLIAGLLTDDDPGAESGIELRTSDGRPLHGRIAWMAQHDHLLPWLRVVDNVLLGARLRGSGRVPAELKAKAMELIERVGMSGLLFLVPLIVSPATITPPCLFPYLHPRFREPLPLRSVCTRVAPRWRAPLHPCSGSTSR